MEKLKSEYSAYKSEKESECKKLREENKQLVKDMNVMEAIHSEEIEKLQIELAARINEKEDECKKLNEKIRKLNEERGPYREEDCSNEAKKKQEEEWKKAGKKQCPRCKSYNSLTDYPYYHYHYCNNCEYQWEA